MGKVKLATRGIRQAQALIKTRSIQRAIFKSNKAGNLVKKGAYAESNFQKYLLRKNLASLEQLHEQGKILAGGKNKIPFRNSHKIAKQYGGQPENWVKKSSSCYHSPDGQNFETHWLENLISRERIEFKTKIRK